MPSQLLLQIKTLTHKNLLLFFRKRGNVLTLLAIPLIISCSMYYVSYLIALSSHLSKNPEPSYTDVAQIPRCHSPANCTTVGYYVIGEREDWIDETMRTLAKRSRLEFGRDVKHLVTTKDPHDVVRYTELHRNQTEVGIIFCTSTWSIRFNNYTLDIPCRLEKLSDTKLVFYSVHYNMTLGIEPPYFFKSNATFPTNMHAVRAKRAVDEALAVQFSGDNEVSFDFRMRSYPTPENKYIKEYDFVSSFGSFFLYVPLAIGFMLVIAELMSEKSRGIKLYMTVSGLNPFVHIISWTIYNVLLSAYFAVTTCLATSVFRFELFTNVPYAFWLLYLFTCGFATNLLSMLISSVSGADRTGNSIAYAFLLFSFVFQVCTTNPNALNGFFRRSLLFKVIRKVLEFYPGFNYTKIWTDLIYFSGTYFDVVEGRYVHGREFDWSLCFEDYEKNTIKGPLVFYSIMESFYYLLRNVALFYVLIVYFEFTLEGNQGVAKGPVHWLRTRLHDYQQRRALKRYSSVRSEDENESIADNKHRSVIEEEHKAADAISSNDERLHKGVVLNGISKTYKRGWFLPKANEALRGIRFTINNGEIFTILGQNGAGKTTLMNILTGFLEPTDGEAYILGHSIPKELSTVRRITSLCPQNDIYWDILTIEEHLRIFAIIKGFRAGIYLDIEISRLLDLVGLSSKRNSEIRHLSGGMRRRLSIAISAIGNPKIIIFDEPTTGLDPIKKQAVLALLKQLKRDRILILTTHSMEEADELSDRILFLKDGEVRCLGTASALKDEFSSGFSLSLIVKQAGWVAEVVRAVHSAVGDVHESNVFDRKIDYKFKQRDTDIAHRILRALISEASGVRDYIEDWSITQATLEDVFFNLHTQQ